MEAHSVDDETTTFAAPSQSVPVQVDYFSYSENANVLLPDGVSFVTIKKLNEGDRKKYQNATNREIALASRGGDAKVRLAPGDDRHALLKASIIGWNLSQGGNIVPFTNQALEMFLQRTDPVIVDLLEKEIRKFNPWLLGELTVEQIQTEIDALEEMKHAKLREDEGKLFSSNS